MSGQTQVAFLVLLMASLQASAADLTVEIRTQTGCLGVPGAAIVAVADGNIDYREIRTSTNESAATYSMDLPESDTWTIHFEAETCWSETVRMLSGLTNLVSLRVFPAAEIKGTLQYGDGDRLRQITGTIFRNDEGVGHGIGGLGESVTCTLQNPTFACQIPAVEKFDLRMDSPGFASVYYWDISAPAHRITVLHPRSLRPGGSFEGWIQDPTGRGLPDASITFQPLEALGSDPSQTPRRKRVTRSGQRGFFQFTNLEPGEYGLVSESHGLSRAIVPAVRIRPGESLRWPRGIRHLPLTSLDLSLSPPTDRYGNPWTVEMKPHGDFESLQRRNPLRKAALPSGHWSAEEIHADKYQISVRSGGGSVLERRIVDLGDGTPATFALEIGEIAVNGVLASGGEPVGGEIIFSDGSGRVVRATASQDGTFDAGFPSPGRWQVRVRLSDQNRYEVHAASVDLEESEETPSLIEIILPGGRVRGKVRSTIGSGVKAVVHVMRDRRLAAQQTTSDDGSFDFIGLAAGSYELEARSSDASTPMPAVVRLEEGVPSEIDLILEPMRTISVIVVDPNGNPASGAVIRLSLDGGWLWRRRVTDVHGRFSEKIPTGVDAVSLLILTYQYPSVLLRLPVPSSGKELTVTLPNDGALLGVNSRDVPLIWNSQGFAPLTMFYFPEPFGRFGGRIHLPVGVYAVCPNAELDESCRRVELGSGSEVQLQLDGSEPGAR